ncbi:alpha/beta hydrolase [Fulvivirga sp.]|uniref:alpha/beta fold hydrolase n=1 Tax=Fulvivirga sp. TaxID=1931237 RepID=UPI0032EAE21B
MKQRKIKTPLPLRIIASTYPIVEAVAPWLAKRWFVKIFFSTAKYKFPHGEIEAAEMATAYNISYESKKVQVYEWGDGKPVLMVHGWMGRGTQFRKFIQTFNEAGYKVVAFDAPGHGKSDGGSSHILKFADVIAQLSERYNGFEMIIGHSLGGVATMHAIIRGVATNKLVMISSPAIADEIMSEFRKKIGATELAMPYFNNHIEQMFGCSFEGFSAKQNIHLIKDIDLLLIYDQDDREVSLDSPKVLMAKHDNAKLIRTSGLGHTRILKDDFVVESTLKHLQSEKEISSKDPVLIRN